MQKNLKISYYGYFTPLGGYGIANISWVKHLRRLGVDVSVHPKFKPEEGSFEWSILTDEEKDMFKAPFEKRKIGIVESNPWDFDTNQSEIRIANTMCESSHVSESWAKKLNAMDYIVVPNEFNKKVFINSGVTKPIYVIPHGVDTERFTYYDRPERELYTFGICGYLDQHNRKGAFELIRAFASEFEPDEPVRLILKSSDPTFGFYSRFKDPRITTITDNYSVEQMNEFYRSLDCFVFPSKAEGIGYPPREAMATGLPTIVTKWSGLSDIANRAWTYPLVPASFEKRPNFIEQDGSWALIDIPDLMKKMRSCYENKESAKIKGKTASEAIKTRFSWEASARKMKEFLNDIS